MAVIDSGQGIDPEQLPHVFEVLPRYSARQRRRGSRTEGSGLGLAIVKTIAEAHGGTATITSRPGDGARFELLLPLAATKVAASPLSSGTTGPT